MSKIYNKEVIAELDVNVFRRDYKVIVLDNKKQNTYDTHIITNHYQNDELNTLILQEPKDAVSVDRFNKLYLTMTITEFALWDEFYDYKSKSYTFSIKVIDEYDI